MAQGGRIMTQKTAIITGGAGGLGLALDNALRGRGWQTILVDLPGPALDALEGLEGRRALPCDLTKSAELSALCAQIRRRSPSVDLVIYNAGVTHIGPCAELTEDTHRKVFDINYFAATRMAQELQSDLRKAKGTHLAISSVAGFSPLLHRTAYAASKHALEGFFKSLRAEEAPHDVRVVIAAPSFVATNLGNAQVQDNGIARPGSATDGVDYMSPDDAAAVILQGLERGKPFIPVGRIARLSYLINRASPALFEWLMRRKMG
jgi:NAD(P)-dependent dehydrogenase (short-subunit alcohol dehydrogenase family)